MLDQIPNRWEPDRSPAPSPVPLPSLPLALGRGVTCRCPACGIGKVFDGYLEVVPECTNCAAPLGLARADDAPPYFTIVLLGHILIPSILYVERTWEPPLWLHAVIWIPLTIVLALAVLRPIKGATVGLMLKLGMLKPAFDE